ncbi:MAG: hypothetical protein HQK99_09340 [Nitrospirae bacterium]|nr:hypothetical protein [Nitrospirota bacterium]
MSLYVRLAVLLIISLAVFSPKDGLAGKCKNKFYTVSLKDSYLKKNYKVRAFFFDTGYGIYGIPKIPGGWRYDFNEDSSFAVIATSYSDKDAIDIKYFKDFFTFIITPYIRGEKKYVAMKLIYIKPNGISELKVLDTKDFVIKEIHKCLKVHDD